MYSFFKSNVITHHLVVEISNIADNIDSFRRRAFCCRTLLGEQTLSVYRFSNGNFFRNIKQNIVGAKGSLRFFRAYHEHSKDIVKVIKDGFGIDSGILGECNYNRGMIEIDYPKEPEMEDIGLARHHIHPDIWKLKGEAESESKTILSEIQTIMSNFDSKIRTELEKETETGIRLIRKDSYLFILSDVFQSCYYNDLSFEIFDEIKMRIDGKQARELCPGYDFTNDNHSLYKLSFEKEGRILLRVKQEDEKTIKSRVEKLLSNPDMSNLVIRYNQLKTVLDTNKKRADFFDSINNLWKITFHEGKSLVKKQRCYQCPLETL
ncbi:MAG: hypothetical protein WAM14_03560 [Candidatus Nitrosopolaris sp.]